MAQADTMGGTVDMAPTEETPQCEGKTGLSTSLAESGPGPRRHLFKQNFLLNTGAPLAGERMRPLSPTQSSFVDMGSAPSYLKGICEEVHKHQLQKHMN